MISCCTRSPAGTGTSNQLAAAAAGCSLAAEVASLLASSKYSKQRSIMDMLAPSAAPAAAVANNGVAKAVKVHSILLSSKAVLLRSVKDACGVGSSGKFSLQQTAGPLHICKQPPAAKGLVFAGATTDQQPADHARKTAAGEQQELGTDAAAGTQPRQHPSRVSRGNRSTPAPVAAAGGTAAVSHLTPMVSEGEQCQEQQQQQLQQHETKPVEKEGILNHMPAQHAPAQQSTAQHASCAPAPTSATPNYDESELLLEVPIINLSKPAGNSGGLLNCILQEVAADIKASLQGSSSSLRLVAAGAGGSIDDSSSSLEALLGKDGQFSMDLYSYPFQKGWASVVGQPTVIGTAGQGEEQQPREEREVGDRRSKKHHRGSCTSTQQPPAAAGAGAAGLEDILARDMQPVEDGIFTLPMVFFDEGAPGCHQVQSSADSWKEMLLACGYRKQPSAHLELYMDWSLLRQCSKPAAAAKGQAARKKPRRSSAAGGVGKLRGEGRVGVSAVGGALESREEVMASKRGSCGQLAGLVGVNEEEVCEANWEADGEVAAMQAAGQGMMGDEQQGAREWGEEICKWVSSQQILQKGLVKLPGADIEGLLAGSWKGLGVKLGQLLGAAIDFTTLQPGGAGSSPGCEVLPATAAKILGLGQKAAGGGLEAAADGDSGGFDAALVCKADQLPLAARQAAAGYSRGTAAAAGGLPATRNMAACGQAGSRPAAATAAAACGAKHMPAAGADCSDAATAAVAPNAAADALPGGRKRGQHDLSDMDYFVSLHSAPSGPQPSKRHKRAGQGAGLREDMAGVVPLAAAAAGDIGSKGAGAAGVLLGVGGAADAECRAEAASGIGRAAAAGAVPSAAGTVTGCSAAQATRAADLASLYLLQLPPHILSLLRQLQSQKDEILVEAGLGHTHLTTCELWELKPVDELLSSCSQDKGQQGVAEKAVIKALVSVLLLGQTALCLAHFGVQVGHLFLSQRLQQLPAVGKSCKGAAEALSAADAAVMEKKVEDHPKQSKLRQVLMAIDAMNPVGEVSDIMCSSGSLGGWRLCLC